MKKENIIPDDFFDIPSDAKFVKIDQEYINSLAETEQKLEDFVRQNKDAAVAFIQGGERPSGIESTADDEDLREEFAYILRKFEAENDPEAVAANLAASLLLTSLVDGK